MELVLFEIFYEVEEYYQDYFEKVSMVDGNINDVYCQFNVVLKIEKVWEKFVDKVKVEVELDV